MEYWHGQPGTKSSNTKISGNGRDLIKEYFARTRTSQEPPPIFRSANGGGQYPAYFPTPSTNSEEEMDLEQVLNFVDENFKEIGVSSVIVPEKMRRDTNCLRRNSESCHLIGKVNPNILRTWEQLNLCQGSDRDDNSEDNKDRQNDAFFDGNTYQEGPEELASFKVNYVTYDRVKARRGKSTEDLYYDSIDEEDHTSSDMSRSNAATFELSSGTVGESIIYRGNDVIAKADIVDIQQPSIMTDSTDQYIQGDPLARGEGMAEFDSLDKKRLKCWSLENEGEF